MNRPKNTKYLVEEGSLRNGSVLVVPGEYYETGELGRLAAPGGGKPRWLKAMGRTSKSGEVCGGGGQFC